MFLLAAIIHWFLRDPPSSDADTDRAGTSGLWNAAADDHERARIADCGTVRADGRSGSPADRIQW